MELEILLNICNNISDDYISSTSKEWIQINNHVRVSQKFTYKVNSFLIESK